MTLPELSDVPIKAKVDTGARTSALHAFRLRIDDGDDGRIASFELHPVQRSSAHARRVEAPVLEMRSIRSSNGKVEWRPVVRLVVRLGPVEWPVECTLTSRDAMGFRMLLGRAAVKRRFLVDPGRSFLLSDKRGVAS